MECAEHVLTLFEQEREDDRPRRAIEIARARDDLPVGAAQRTSVAAHAAAGEVTSRGANAAVRDAGHAVLSAMVLRLPKRYTEFL